MVNIKTVYYYLSTFFILFLIGCKSEVIRKEYDTQIKVTVVDEGNKPLDGAIVAVFDSLQAYNKSILIGEVKNAIAVLTTDGKGFVNATNLPEVPESNFAKDIWVATFHRSTTLFPGFSILYDNDSINFRPAETFRKGSINEVTLKLRPAEGLVTFYVDESQNTRLPIYVYNKEILLDTLTSTDIDDNEALSSNQNTHVFKKRIAIMACKIARM